MRTRDFTLSESCDLGSHGSGTGVKTGPGSKSQEGVSGGVSEGVSGGPGGHPKKSQKRVSGVKKQVNFDSQSLPETRF